MYRTWKLLSLPVLLAMLAVAPSRAADPELDKNDARYQQILRLLTEMQQANAQQQKYNDARDAIIEMRMLGLRERIAELELKLDRLEKGRVSNYPSPLPGVTPDLERDLQARLDRMERDLKNRLDRMERRSAFYPPSDTVTPPPLPALPAGAVRIQNRSLMTSTVVVNGITYTVPPLQSVTIPNLPAGAPFTYEVVQDARGFSHPPQVRTVPVNETYVVYINP
jgi:hypothetical protein